MYHRGKKRERKIPTPEEQKKIEENAAKVSKTIQDFLEVRQDTSKVTDPLKHTTLIAELAPEIYTIFNLRKELIESHLEKVSDAKEKYAFLGKEIEFLMPMQKQYPKSYTLWYHRQWCLLKMVALEKELGFSPKESCLVKEFYLCNKMLDVDERNFHVWNYRNWVTRVCLNNQTIEEVIQFTKKKLDQNFCNYSALHFRSKYLTEKYQRVVADAQNLKASLQDSFLLDFKIPQKVLDEELELIKTGLYMQPNEQSLWLYHKYIIALILPVQLRDVIPLKAANGETSEYLLCFNENLSYLSPFNLLIEGGDSSNVSVQAVGSQHSSRFWVLRAAGAVTAIRLRPWSEALQKVESVESPEFQDFTKHFENSRMFSPNVVFRVDTSSNKVTKENHEAGANTQTALKTLQAEKEMVDEINSLEKNCKFGILHNLHLLTLDVRNTSDQPRAENYQKIIKLLEEAKTVFTRQANMFEHYIQLNKGKLLLENNGGLEEVRQFKDALVSDGEGLYLLLKARHIDVLTGTDLGPYLHRVQE